MPYLYRKTKDLIVRPLHLADYEKWKIANMAMEPSKNKWDRKSKTLEEASLKNFKKILQSQKSLRDQDKYYDLAIFEKKTRNHVGTVAAMDVLRGLGQSAYLGYFINNQFWGRGYGKQAVLAIIDIAFKDLKLHRLEAGIEPTNRRSLFLARSVKLRKEGLKKRAVFLRNTWVDLVMYSATCEEFGVKWKNKPQTRIR